MLVHIDRFIFLEPDETLKLCGMDINTKGVLKFFSMRYRHRAGGMKSTLFDTLGINSDKLQETFQIVLSNQENKVKLR